MSQSTFVPRVIRGLFDLSKRVTDHSRYFWIVPAMLQGESAGRFIWIIPGTILFDDISVAHSEEMVRSKILVERDMDSNRGEH